MATLLLLTLAGAAAEAAAGRAQQAMVATPWEHVGPRNIFDDEDQPTEFFYVISVVKDRAAVKPEALA